MSEVIGLRIGPIRVTERLAEGGMGEVYAGWDERLERRVALKAVHRDHRDGEVRARLLREARILTRLQDTKICQIFDYVEGEHTDWLVLELVDGETLAEADLGALGLESRLEIAQQVAEVLVETHAKGIIHRDLKPSNVMLTADRTIKVLDFGIARFSDTAENARLPEPESGSPPRGPGPGASPLAPDAGGPSGDPPGEPRTRLGQVLGTILYMSPEQARGEAVTPATDLYSFGLLLREILTGEPTWPADTPPLLIVSKVARGERPPPAAGLGDGELAELIDDLTRPAARSRPTAAEAVRRLSWRRGRPRRNRRRALVAGAFAAAAMAASLYAVSLRAAARESVAARDRAEAAKLEAQELSGFLVGLFSAPADAETAAGLTARQILERGAARLEQDFAGRPRLQARLASTLGDVYQNLGAYQRSRQLLEHSLHLLRSVPEPEPLVIARTLSNLGWTHRYEGNYQAAEAHFREALALRQAALGPNHQDVASSLNGLAVVERRQGRLEEAEAHYLRALEIIEVVHGPDHPNVAKGLNNLALLYYHQGRYGPVEAMYRRALAINEASFEPNHPSIARVLSHLANVLTDQAKYDEAEALYRRSLAIWQQIAGPDHPQSANSADNLGLLFEESGRWQLAEQFLLQGAEIRARALGTDHPDYAYSLSNLGGLYLLWRRFEQAESRLLEAMAIQEAQLGADHTDLGLSLGRLAALRLGGERPRDARPLAVRSLEIHRGSFGDRHRETAYSLLLLGLCDLAEGDLSSSRARLGESVEGYGATGVHSFLEQLVAEAVREANRAEPGREDLPALVSRLVAPGSPEAMGLPMAGQDADLPPAD